MAKTPSPSFDVEACPIQFTLTMMSGKWKPALIHMLIAAPMRFGALRRALPGISHKMLTQRLRELETDGLVHREVFPEVPPRVEYSLSERGHTLAPVLVALYDWGKARQAEVATPTP
mgnify:CR=1 FL=1|jgi:DNA-binding HxlR family transcriptional regulator